MSRFSELDVAAWREDGFTIVPEFFSAAELAPVLADYERLYGCLLYTSPSPRD